MRRVLFLDIDGVLNSTDYLRASGGLVIVPFDHDPAGRIDPDRVARLNRIVEGIGVDVVLSSSWRAGFTLGEVQRFLRARGFAGRLHDKTPRLSANERHVEIKRWLSQQCPDVERFVVLDDDPGAGVGLGHRFVRCCDGIEDAQVEAARRILE